MLTDTAQSHATELVADILRAGGLMSMQSNPGAATPESLHSMYASRGAVSANPFLLRDKNFTNKFNPVVLTKERDQIRDEQRMCLVQQAIDGARGTRTVGTLKVVAERRQKPVNDGLSLSLVSLDMARSLNNQK